MTHEHALPSRRLARAGRVVGPADLETRQGGRAREGEPERLDERLAQVVFEPDVPIEECCHDLVFARLYRNTHVPVGIKTHASARIFVSDGRGGWFGRRHRKHVDLLTIDADLELLVLA